MSRLVRSCPLHASVIVKYLRGGKSEGVRAGHFAIGYRKGVSPFDMFRWFV